MCTKCGGADGYKAKYVEVYEASFDESGNRYYSEIIESASIKTYECMTCGARFRKEPWSSKQDLTPK